VTTLRPYQVQPFRAIVAAAINNTGGTYTVMFARQAGKNETSAHVERALMAAYQTRRVTGIKAAPTLKPQADISRDRLRKLMDLAGLATIYRDRDHFLYLVKARWAFLSAGKEANVIGLTADLLLEADEAQDIDPAKFDKDFRPMASTTNAPVAMWGTAWTDDTLLAQAITANADTHPERNFRVPWTVVAEHVPAYARYVAAERDRLGANHPLFLTQYELETLPGAGRLLSPAQLALILTSDHPRQTIADPNDRYVAGIDVAGEDPEGQVLRGRDSTVVTIGRLSPTPSRLPRCDIVAAYEYTGTEHGALYAEIAALLGTVWHVARVAVDATTLGEALALMLTKKLGASRVLTYRFTEASKSHLGYELQAAATTGRLHLWLPDSSREYLHMGWQLTHCRAEYRPNRMVRWFVPPAEGHDDHVVAIALCLEAARTAPAGVARGRISARP
jgi:hypothetical protein